MNIFKSILIKIFGEPKKIHDSLFGEMIDADGYYECNVYFKPINKKIEIGIGGDENGPTKEARLFYKEIEANYDTIVKVVSPKISENLLNWNPKIRIDNFKNEFNPIYLFIPGLRSIDQDWEIAFETIHDSHLITVVMNKYKPKFVRIDG